MKTKQKLAILIIIVTLLAVGCSDSSGVAPLEQSKQTDKVITDENVTSDVQTESNEPEEEKYLRDNIHVLIRIDDIDEKSNLKDQVIKRINENNGEDVVNADSDNPVGNINAFYFPADINGYELVCVLGGEYGFVYYFTPVGNLKTDELYMFSDNSDIQITIEIPGKSPFSFSDSVKDNAKYGYILTEDNLLYKEGETSLTGQVGEVAFRIGVPSHLAKYEYLRDLAFDVIKNAELVTVKD
ncbi:MAG: hypothetical protein FWG83_05625 [Oscillospiraceae bacterium]|nr:hypothetical protein [Oscillospiraceae bacterium]